MDLAKNSINDLLRRMSGADHASTQLGGEVIYHKIRADALHEVREIRDLKIVPYLDELLKKDPDNEVRWCIFFLIGHLGANTHSALISKLLLEHLVEEKEKEVLVIILSALEKQQLISDYHSILRYVNHKSPLVRRPALLLIGRWNSQIAEKVLTDQLNKRANPFEKVIILESLAQIKRPSACLDVKKYS